MLLLSITCYTDLPTIPTPPPPPELEMPTLGIPTEEIFFTVVEHTGGCDVSV